MLCLPLEPVQELALVRKYNFGMLEAKTAIALILEKFSFSLSPDYKHTPGTNLVLRPQNGLPVVVMPLR